MRMPLRRMLALIGLARERDGVDRAQFVADVRAAVWAESKKLKGYVRELENG